MSQSAFVPVHEIRAKFSRALSEMYAEEVPLYQTLVDTVKEVNAEIIKNNPDIAIDAGDISRISEERHGAIRIGRPDEMRDMARLFETIGMFPVEYYDLTLDGLPVHSTAFRPIEQEEMDKNPFRVFTSLLRMDIIKQNHPEVFGIAEDALSKRKIFSDKLLELVKTNELNGGLTEPEANEFVLEAMKTFKWQKKAAVSLDDYEKLLEKDALLADIAGFLNPHINHLTPRVLDIDLLYQKMKEKGVKMISAIQGPPAMEADSLLRQTSFQALVEDTMFVSADGTLKAGKHRARFGEVEQRGIALKPEGRELYDQYIEKVRAKAKQTDPNYKEVLEATFKDFASTYEELRKKGLAYFRYVPTGKPFSNEGKIGLEELISAGALRAEPIIYEDFLPVSAAGIFRSNLVDGGKAEISEEQSDKRAMLEAAMGKKIINAFELYAAIEAKSIEKAYKAIGAIMPDDLAKKVLPAVRSDPVAAKKNSRS